MKAKTKLLLFFIALLTLNSNAQVDFESHIIVDQNAAVTANGANTSEGYDLDGDGDLDVLFSSWQDEKVGWYENTDGQGTFGEQNIISSMAHTNIAVHAADLDGDGDLDVLSAGGSVSGGDGKIVWYENTDGLGNFGAEQIIFSNGGRETEVIVADIDNDGDLDVISGSFDGTVAWYKNTNGLGDFSAQNIVTVAAATARSIAVQDMDGDNDMDVVAAISASSSGVDSSVEWYENIDGQGTFVGAIITTEASRVRSVFVGDIDNDGDYDVVSASWGDDKIAWYENVDGLGDFGAQQILSDEIDSAIDVFAADLDADGDLDVLFASWGDETAGWFENTDGLGSFGEHEIINDKLDGISQVFAADIDGDTDLDVLTASQQDDKIVWHENLLLTTSIASTNLLTDFEVYPSPASTFLVIESETEIVQVEIHDGLGRLLLRSAYEYMMDVSQLQPGFYLCTVRDVNGAVGTKKFVKK